MHDDANPVHLNALSVFLVLGAHAGPGVVPVPMDAWSWSPWSQRPRRSGRDAVSARFPFRLSPRR